MLYQLQPGMANRPIGNKILFVSLPLMAHAVESRAVPASG
jgi:hypothetical protein